MGIRTSARCCLLALVAAAPAQSVSDYAGFVVTLRGSWQVALPEPGPLEPGQKLKTSSRIFPPWESRDAGLEIALADGKALVLNCNDKADDCRRALDLPAALSGELPLYQRLIAIAHDLFSEHPALFTPTIVRDPLPLLQDIVTTQRDGKVDLSAARRPGSTGLYRLRVTRWKDGTVVQELKADWRRTPEPIVLSAESAPPGLYRLALLDWQSGSTPKDDALALVSMPSSYGRDLERFEQATRATQEWPSISADGRRIFLRSYMAVIAESNR